MKKPELLRRKSYLTMLLTAVLLFAGHSSLWAQLSVTAKDPTMGQIIEAVKKQSTYQFFYNTELTGMAVRSVDMKNVTLDALLTEALKGTQITYKIDENVCYLSTKDMSGEGERSTRTVSGRVTDSRGLPLAGVAVSVEGTTTGTATNNDGYYQLRVPGANASLTYSYIGYQTRVVSVGRQTTEQNVTMAESAVEVEQVVVTALGIKRSHKALSYNVQEVNSSELTMVKDANLVNALAGKVAGMTVNTSSSGVGGASKVVMRGSKSIQQSSNVLYVIDGMPMFNMGGEGSTEFGSTGSTEAIADINPEDIESVSALSGAAASALYGNNAANGVILITTKKGTAGQTHLTVASGMDVLSPFVLPRFQNRYGTGSNGTTSGSTILSWGPRLNAANYQGYSPREDFFETGMVFNNSVALSTGNEKNQTYISAATINSNGVVPNNQYDRYNFTIRNTTTFLDDKMKLDLGGSYIVQKDQNMINQGVYSNPLTSAYLYPRGDDWEMTKIFERWNATDKYKEQYWPQGEGDFRMQNPYWMAYRNLKNNDRKRFMMNAGLSYDILPWLNVAGRARIDYSANDYTEKLYASSNSTLSGANGNFGKTKSNDKQTYADVLLNINKRTDCFSLVANVGASISDLYYDALAIVGPLRETDEDGIANNFKITDIDPTRMSKYEDGYRKQTQSVFASVEVGYKGMYYLTVTGRNDWPSQLGGAPQQKSGFFYPSAGLSAVLSEIFNLPKQISYLKLRGSYASVGTPFAAGLAIPTYEFNQTNLRWETAHTYQMRKLYAERTNSWEAGVTMRFLRHFNLDFTAYSATTHNQTFQPLTSASTGYASMYVQTGSVRNQGIEASLGFTNRWNNFTWNSNYTFGMNRNKIMEMVENYYWEGEYLNISRLDIGGLARARYILYKGGSLGDLYSTADMVRDSNGRIYVDNNGAVTTRYGDTVTDIPLGSTMPKYNMAWKNDFAWKGLSASFMVTARLGGIVYSATQAAMDLYGVSEASAAARDNGGVWINGGKNLVDAQTWYTAIGSQSGLPQYYTYDATNIRLQEARIGYTIPRHKLGGVVDLTISLVGRNLWMIYNKAPFDPEAVATTGNYYQGIDYFMMPSMRNIGFNVRLKF